MTTDSVEGLRAIIRVYMRQIGFYEARIRSYEAMLAQLKAGGPTLYETSFPEGDKVWLTEPALLDRIAANKARIATALEEIFMAQLAALGDEVKL